jgi:hypothetical protein
MEELKKALLELKKKVGHLMELNDQTKDGQNKELIDILNKEIEEVEAVISQIKAVLEDEFEEKMKKYGYELPNGKIVDIRALTEKDANQKLLSFLLENGYVDALGECVKTIKY